MDHYHIPRDTFAPMEQPVLEDVQSVGLKIIILLSMQWFRRGYFLFLCSFCIIGYVYSTYGKIQIKGTYYYFTQSTTRLCVIKEDRCSYINNNFSSQFLAHVSFVVFVIEHVAYFLLTLSIIPASFTLLRYERNKENILKIVRYISSRTTTKSVFG